MPRPDRAPDPHPVPRQRQVLITPLDKHSLRFPQARLFAEGGERLSEEQQRAEETARLERLLERRGFDLRLPYTQVDAAGDGDLYVQDIPPDEAA